MPLFDYKCLQCGRVEEVLVRRETDLVPCHGECNHVSTKVGCDSHPFHMVMMERQPSAPSSFIIKGFNAVNGYASPRVFKQDHGNGIKTTVTGNPEAFADGF